MAAEVDNKDDTRPQVMVEQQKRAALSSTRVCAPLPPRGILLRIEEQSRPHRRENCRPPRQHEHRRLPACLTCRIPFPPHLARSFPPHLVPIPPCAPTLHVLVRGVDTIPYKPWHSTSSSHSHSFSPRTHGFRSTTIPAVVNNNNSFYKR